MIRTDWTEGTAAQRSPRRWWDQRGRTVGVIVAFALVVAASTYSLAVVSRTQQSFEVQSAQTSVTLCATANRNRVDTLVAIEAAIARTPETAAYLDGARELLAPLDCSRIASPIATTPVELPRLSPVAPQPLIDIPPPLPGPAGRDGIDGKDGLPGRDGIDGKDGLPGADSTVPGPPGTPGPAGMTVVVVCTPALLTSPPCPAGFAPAP